MITASVPFWKKWLSYLIEYELEKVDSEHGHSLSLCLSDGRFQLNTHKAIYSWEDKYDNFYKAFEKLDWEKLNCSSVLSLGFGLGSIVQMLEQNFKKSFYYTGVEIDDAVIYLAEKYVLKHLKSNIQVIQAPAQIFVETSQEKFDLITIDIFINDQIPKPIRNKQFLENTANRLEAGGLILMNHLANTKKDLQLVNEFYADVFQKVFPDSAILDVDGNYIFYSNKDFLIE